MTSSWTLASRPWPRSSLQTKKITLPLDRGDERFLDSFGSGAAAPAAVAMQIFRRMNRHQTTRPPDNHQRHHQQLHHQQRHHQQLDLHQHGPIPHWYPSCTLHHHACLPRSRLGRVPPRSPATPCRAPRRARHAAQPRRVSRAAQRAPRSARSIGRNLNPKRPTAKKDNIDGGGRSVSSASGGLDQAH